MSLVLVSGAILVGVESGPELGVRLTNSSGAKWVRPSAASEAQAEGRDLIGRASVIDGDTIQIKGERVRFSGIDAPEASQLCQDASGTDYRCGSVSARELDRFLAEARPTRCKYESRDRYGRFVGDCFRADGKSVSTWLVRNGYAIDWPRYSGGAYSRAQAAAKTERLGVWQGRFQKPWEWRAARR